MNILVIYYSQSGQLKRIIESMFANEKSVQLDFLPIQPVRDFSFPWTTTNFFDAMPECVLQIPEDIQPMHFPDKSYDLIVFGHNPWFLSPNIPTTSFLKSPYAEYLKNKQVLTVIGARNMWLNAQEKVKADLLRLEAHLVGNAVLVDTRPNLVSVLTIIRWAFKGIKEKTRFLPEAGIPEEEIQRAQTFGRVIVDTFQNHALESLQDRLIAVEAVKVQPGLVVLEKRGLGNFRKFATRIQSKGPRGAEERKPLVKLFQRLLVVGVFILSPISNFTAFLSTLLHKKEIAQQIRYFLSVRYEKDVM
jgi:hypothetical protein